MNNEYGAKFADKTGIRYDQTTKIIERVFADLKAAKELKFWLESCNVCACACGVEAAGGEWRAKLPLIDGKEIITQADLLFDFCYSTYGKSLLPDVKDGVMENEIAANLAVAITHCSTCIATVKTFNNAKELIASMKDSLSRKCAIAMSYMTDYKTGHYIEIGKYSETKKCFVGNDSWSDNVHCKNGGKNEEYTDEFIASRARLRYIEIAPPK